MLLHSDSEGQEPYTVSMLKEVHLKATAGNEAWIFMTVSLTQLLPTVFTWAWKYLRCFPRHSFSVHPYFSSSVHIHGQTKQNKTKQTKPLTLCFLKELFPPNAFVSFCYGIIVKLQDCTLGVSAIRGEPLAYIITYILSGVTKVVQW